MRIEEFDYQFPKDLIAQYPPSIRGESRLMVLNREKKEILHRSFSEMTELIREGDILVVNDTKVIPARIFGKKESGGKIEVFLLNRLQSQKEKEIWQCLLRSSKRPRVGSRIFFPGEVAAKILEREEEEFKLEFDSEIGKLLDQIGQIPLPPYIKRKQTQADGERYQTIFARVEGAVASPTAGLHFSQELISKLEGKGVEILSLTLHTGFGSFKPVRTGKVEAHKMEAEYFHIPLETAKRIWKAKEEGRRIICVGTGCCRALEYAARENGGLKQSEGSADLFIYPGYEFKVPDALVTNFHLPRSSPLLLVAAFAGRNFLLSAYREAIEKRYRLYSFGDVMLIL